DFLFHIISPFKVTIQEPCSGFRTKAEHVAWIVQIIGTRKGCERYRDEIISAVAFSKRFTCYLTPAVVFLIKELSCFLSIIPLPGDCETRVSCAGQQSLLQLLLQFARVAIGVFDCPFSGPSIFDWD